MNQSAVQPAPAETTDPEESRWGFSEGDEIAPGRTAIKLLGGGFRYEAYLTWDDRLRALVVLKVVRPGLVSDQRTLSGLAGEVEMLERLSHPVLVRSFGYDLEGRGRSSHSSTSRGPGCRASCAATARSRSSRRCPWHYSSAPPPTT